MKCCGSGMMGAFAEKAGAIDSMHGFIVAFVIVLCVTAAWGDISKMLHLKLHPAVQGPPIEQETPEERI